MAKILFGVIAAAASLMLVEAATVTCNQCNYGLADFCLSNTEVSCDTSTKTCFTAKTTFPSISNTVGFNKLGCQDKPTGTTDNCKDSDGNVLGIKYETKVTCCETDKCNTVQLSGAPSAKMTLTTAIGAAILASMCGSLL